MDFKVLKSQPDKMLVFGWASIAQYPNGESVADMQGDVISPEALEDGAYEYVLNFRDTGVEHDDSLRKKGKLVESVVLTKEKMDAMGIPSGIVPIGWWVGFKITDEATWQLIKAGRLKMFSIQGQGSRKNIAKNVSYLDFNGSFYENRLSIGKNKKMSQNRFSNVLEKFNPYHDSRGRFCSGYNATSMTVRTKDSSKQKLADAGIEREKKATFVRPESRELAKKAYDQAVAAEPGFTAVMKSVAEKTGGELVGLKHCIKTEAKIGEKIERVIAEQKQAGNDWTPEQAAASLKDSNRYTLSASTDKLVDTVKETVKAMEDAGYTCIKKKCTFADGEQYYGINTVYESSTGARVEVQLNTPESLKVKEVNHKLYEEQRKPSTSDDEKIKLGDQMAQNMKSVKIPDNIQELFDNGFKKSMRGVKKMYDKEYYYGKSLNDDGQYDIVIHKEGGPFIGKPVMYSRLHPDGEHNEDYAFCEEDIDFDRLDEGIAKDLIEKFKRERIDGK